MCPVRAIPGVEPFRRRRCRMIEMDALHHLRQALRSFGRQPGLTTIIVGTLALGVGLNAAVFAVAYTVLWRPLPYPEPDRLATIELTHGGERSGGVRPARYRDWSDRLRSADLAGVQQRERRVRGNGPARITATALVSESFFDVLGVGAARGRLPRPAPGDGRAVISGRLAGELGGGRDVVGQMLSVGDELLEIAAVMPDDFGLPSGTVDVWTAPPPGRDPSEGRFDLIARLRSGATLAQLGQEAERISRELRGDDWGAATSRRRAGLRRRIRGGGAPQPGQRADHRRGPGRLSRGSASAGEPRGGTDRAGCRAPRRRRTADAQRRCAPGRGWRVRRRPGRHCPTDAGRHPVSGLPRAGGLRESAPGRSAGTAHGDRGGGRQHAAAR